MESTTSKSKKGTIRGAFFAVRVVGLVFGYPAHWLGDAVASDVSTPLISTYQIKGSGVC